MATVTHQRAKAPAHEEDERGLGWLIFASTVLGLAGIMSAIHGIVALSRSKFYTADAVYVFSDLRTWGWIVLGIGVLLIVAAMGTLSGSAFGRWFGIIVAGLAVPLAMMSIPAYPFWALVLVAVNVLVIYGLAAYGGKPELTR